MVSKTSKAKAAEKDTELKVELPEEKAPEGKVQETEEPKVVAVQEDPKPEEKSEEPVEETQPAEKPKNKSSVEVPEGYALVPVEPTNQQIGAGFRYGGVQARAIYKVMVEQYLKDSK